MTLKQIADEWFDKTVPYPVPDPYELQGQCVQFIRWLLDNYYNLPQWYGVSGAADFWSRYEKDPNMYKYFDKIPNTPELVPQEGDIFIQDHSKGGGYGHIGVVIGIENTVRYFYAVEQNYKPLKVSTVQHNYNACLGFFRVKKEAV